MSRTLKKETYCDHFDITSLDQGTRLRSTSQPNQSTLNWAALITEFLIIVIAAAYATSVYMDFDPAKRLGGIEAEYLTRTAYPVPLLLREKGYIPRWDPFMESGDPMLENPVTFAFNPLLMPRPCPILRSLPPWKQPIVCIVTTST